MSIHVLGSGGYYPSERRHTSCLMIPESGIVLDAGTGFFRVKECIRSEELHIFISHAHLDHICGLTYLIGNPLEIGSQTYNRLWPRTPSGSDQPESLSNRSVSTQTDVRSCADSSRPDNGA